MVVLKYFGVACSKCFLFQEKKGNVLNDEEPGVQEDEAPSTSKQPVKAKRKRKTGANYFILQI